MSTISVRNQSGQVAHFDVTGDTDPRKVILEQRIARGELTKVGTGDKSDVVNRRTVVVVEDEHTGVTDEKGDLLKSVHGGGNDPDAKGDALGQPSGSEIPKGATVVEAYRGEHVLTETEVGTKASTDEGTGDGERAKAVRSARR